MRKTFCAVLAAIFMVTSLPSWAGDTPNLTVGELIAKHLASLGTPDARLAHNSCGIEAATRFTIIKAGAGQGDGSLRMASEGQKFRMVMKFNTPNYMGEDFLSDGSKVNVAIRAASKPTLLSQFFQPRIDLLKEGLFGGALTSGWLLMDPKAPQLKFKYTGVKKIDGRDLHELQYETRKEFGDLRVHIYLEPDTYRHVLTTYDATMRGQSTSTMSTRGRAMTNMSSQESRLTLKEQFGDFKTLEGVTVPTTWTIVLTGDTTAGAELQWTITVQDMVHGEIDAATFKAK